MNAILEPGSPEMQFATDMRAVLNALGERADEFDWIVTDVDVSAAPTLPDAIKQFDFVVSGRELRAALDSCTSCQFGWAVFSGVPRETPLTLPEEREAPGADGNSRLWMPGSTPQHPDAIVEIVCWDSTYTLLISKDEELVARFRAAFPSARDLDDYVAALRQSSQQA